MTREMNILNLRFLLALAAYVAIFIAATVLSAQAEESTSEDSNWVVNVGLGVMTAPEFEGSNKYKAGLLPLVSIEYKERFFLSTMGQGLGLYLVREPEWNLGLAAGHNAGRKEKDSDLLKGLGDVKEGTEATIFAEWTPAPFTVGLAASKGTGDIKGFKVTASIGAQANLTDSLQWTNSISSTYADAKYNQTFFGINEKQSRNSKHQYEKYTPGGGIKDAAYATSLNYTFFDNWTAVIMGEYKLLTGPVADSPLVKAGSKNQAAGGLGVFYTF